MSKKPRNVAASVRERLRQLARDRGEDFQLVLTRYGMERLLYRLGASAHAPSFVLKGAMLFHLWGGPPHRPTHDLDLLGRGEVSPERFEQVFREVCAVAAEDDGLTFPPDAVRGESIKEDQEYGGVRVHCVALLDGARVPLRIDVGFGDAVTPAPPAVEYPTLLDFPAPALRAYPRQTVVAEKFQAMVALGMANSRMKDFFDLWYLSDHFAFDGPSLAEAIAATFRRRRTAVPAEPPLGLTEVFVGDAAKRQQWRAFLNKSRLATRAPGLEEVAEALRSFVMPPASAAASGAAFEAEWPAAGPWRAVA